MRQEPWHSVLCNLQARNMTFSRVLFAQGTQLEHQGVLPRISLGYSCQCSGHESDLWSVKMSHAVEQLGPSATATKPAL